ncbi:sigma-70 family RNA polymerase sigma factor, partial [Akkermansiaceae bacterium]|nr:sigma-70 family RNA polymerase sigma factor [Akkermansiaceae bacterium]
EADAWDLSQEVFLKVWKALPKFEARAKFSTWLYRITHNVVYDWLRKRKIESAGELDDGILNESDIAAGARTTPTKIARPKERSSKNLWRI